MTACSSTCLLPTLDGTAGWVRTSGGFENDFAGPVVDANIDPNTGSFDVTIQIATSTNYPTWVGEQITFAVTPGTPGSITWTWVTVPWGSATAAIDTSGFTIS